MRFVPVFAGVGAAALLAGLSVVAADPHNAHGKAVSAVARSSATDKEAHGDAVSQVASANGVARLTQVKTVARTDQPQPGVSDACSTALAKLKVAVSADRTEDQTERKALEVAGTTEAAEIAAIAANRSADQAEDASELTALRNAVSRVRAACVRPEAVEAETTACTAAENGLEAVRDRQPADPRFQTMTPALLTSLQQAVTRVCGA